MIGLAQAIFVWLIISYAEQVGFQTAYRGAASATIGLITVYGVLGMKMRRRVAVLGLLLVVLYSSLFMILHSDDYALLIGSTLAFVVLAATMYVTRNEEWYDPNTSPSKGFLTWPRNRKPPQDTSA